VSEPITDAEWRERAELVLREICDLDAWGWAVPREVRQMAGRLLGDPLGELSTLACLVVPALPPVEIKAFLVERAASPINNLICRTEAYARTAAWEYSGDVFGLAKVTAPNREPLSVLDERESRYSRRRSA
jgi:hypothetical protein